MIETQLNLLNEIVSNMAKKFEEEKKEMEGVFALKEAEIAFLKQETENKSGQLESAENQIKSLEEQIRLSREQNARQEAEVNGLKGSMEEMAKARKEDVERLDREHQEVLAKEKELIEVTLRSMEQMMLKERTKWHDALRSN